MMRKHNRTLLVKSAAIATGASAFTPQADASIVHHTGAPVSISTVEQLVFSMTTGYVYVEDADAIVDLEDEDFLLNFNSQESDKPSIFNDSDAGNGGAAFRTVDSTRYAINFDESDLIGSDQTFRNGGLFINDGNANDDEWPLGSTGFLGLRFDSMGEQYYGWAEIEYSNDSNLILKDFAYEDSGDPIAAGAIPEPGTLALIASVLAGSAALYNRRRRD